MTTLITRSLAIGLGLYLCSLPTLVLAKPKFNPPSGRGLPGRREPAGTRGQCLAAKAIPNAPKDPAALVFPDHFKTLAVLVPAADKSIGYTVSEYPTFFWYLPEFKPGYANMLEFSLFEYTGRPGGKPIYRSTSKVTGPAGVMSLALPPNDAPPLQVGKTYRWSVTVICDLEDRAGEDTAEGYIERIAPSADLQRKLQKAKPAEIPEIYAEAGVWYEALSSLANLRRTKSDKNLATLWSTLIQEVGLSKLAQESLVDCCRPTTNQVKAGLPNK